MVHFTGDDERLWVTVSENTDCLFCMKLVIPNQKQLSHSLFLWKSRQPTRQTSSP